MHHSLWIEEYNINGFPELKTNLETDVVIVGAGITGITTGLLLTEEGFKVAIVEANKVMHGTTGHTTGKVTIQHGLIYHDLARKFGLEKAQLYANSNILAMELIKSNIKEFSIDCDFETLPSYIYTQKDSIATLIEKEYEIAKKLNIDCFLKQNLDLPFETVKAIGFKNQGHFNVTKYLHTLIEQFSRADDSYIFEHSKVTDVIEDNNMCHTYLDNGVNIKSRHVVIASHYPCNNTLNLYFTKLKPSTAYVIAAKYHVPFEKGDYINIEKPVHSLRTQKYLDDDLLLIAGENHQTGCSSRDNHYEKLALFGKEHFQIEDPLFKWSTQDFKTFDKLPYIGRINHNSPHIIVATGFKKWGMTMSHVAAILARDLITNKKTDYEALYDPRRLSDKLTCKYFDYNLHSVKHWIGDRLKSAPKDFDVQNGEGKIVSYKGKKYGAYKDDEGELFIVDATCPHLKCILSFNHEQKTYDCPCHGSRFTYKGKYIDGPSIKDLKRINFKNK